MNGGSLNQRVENIKNNKEEVCKLIEEYKPFIASTVEKAVGRFVSYGVDDELSIGLIAFEEAIRAYNITKGNFLAFAKNVIQRRLIDYYRKEHKHSKVVPFIERRSIGDDFEEFDNTAEESIKVHKESEIAAFRREEINELKKELQKWKISFSDIEKSSPKHEATRKFYWEIINIIINNKEILKTLKEKRYLPIAEVEKFSKVPRKTIERGRIYIIAVVVILTGGYEYLEGFLGRR